LPAIETGKRIHGGPFERSVESHVQVRATDAFFCLPMPGETDQASWQLLEQSPLPVKQPERQESHIDLLSLDAYFQQWEKKVR